MTKTYTIEEIVRRLKAWESITAINECEMRHNEGKALKIGKTYKINKLFTNWDIEIKSELFNVHIFDVDSFSDYFMFTSDYEKMKSEEKGMEAAYKTIQEEKKLPFVNLGSTTLIEKNDIPEWLQRERVAHWSRVFATHASLGKKEDVCINWANSGVEQFDKRFLNQKD